MTDHDHDDDHAPELDDDFAAANGPVQAERTALVIGRDVPGTATLGATLERALADAGARVMSARPTTAAAPPSSATPNDSAAPVAADVDADADGGTVAAPVRAAGAWLADGLDGPVAPDALFAHAVASLGHVDILVVLGAAEGPPGDGAAVPDGSSAPRDGTSVRDASAFCAAFIRHLVPGHPGRIVLISPVPPAPGDDEARPSLGDEPPGTLDALARSLAPAVASIGVTVNAVDPADRPRDWLGGYLRRRLEPVLPAGTLDGPDDVARVVCFLASDAGAPITGQVVRGARVP